MQCKGRYCREKKELKFPAVSGYFTEQRCSHIALSSGSDAELCSKCQEASQRPFVNKNQQHYYQGKVDGPYFEQSWLFGSPRFLKYNSLPNNALSAEDFAAAEAAQRIARQGLQIQDVPMPPKKTPVPKTNTSKPPCTPAKPSVIAVESPDEPLEALEVTVIHIKSLESNGLQYWLDDENTVYEKCENSSVGKVIGSWNSKKNQIVFKTPLNSDLE